MELRYIREALRLIRDEAQEIIETADQELSCKSGDSSGESYKDIYGDEVVDLGHEIQKLKFKIQRTL